MQSRALRFVLIQMVILTGALFLSGCNTLPSFGTATPVILPVGGTYTYIPALTITDATPGAAIYFTIDGSIPTVSSNLYSSSTPLTVSQSETVNVIAVNPTGSGPSAVASASYTINLPPAPTPVLTPAARGYTAAQSVTITDTAPGATIYYTTNGTTPTTSSTPYTGTPIIVTSSETLNAVAISQGYGYGYSAVGGGAYTILVQPTLSLAAGTYTTTQQVALSDTTTGASIYYTTNGTTPTISSTPYTGAITVSATEIITVIAAVTVPGGGTVTTSPVSATYIIHPPGTSSVLSGTIVSGQPVVGASVQLYAVGTTGYTSAATSLLASPLMTDSTGSFNLSGKYTCTPGTYLYLTASGGATSAGKGANDNLTLAALAGLCDNLTSASSFVLNEETTVAAAYALAQFSGGTSFGHTQLSQTGSLSSAPADNFATSATNITGLANAMAIDEILVSATGSSPGTNSNASATPEWWQLNLIADMLSACVNSAGGNAGNSSPCGTLFGNVGGTAPADTLQAALDLALHPTLTSTNIANLYGLLSSSSPFTPYSASAAAITDFSVGIEYAPVSGPTSLLSQPSGMAIDSLGNAWISSVPHSSSSSSTAPSGLSTLVELTPTGVPIQAGATAGSYLVNSYLESGTSTATPMSGQVWLNGSNYQLTGLLVPSIDTTNNVWFNDRQKGVIAEVTGSGTSYSNSLSYSNGGNASVVGIAIPTAANPPIPISTYVDGNNNVWFNMTNVDRPSSCGSGFATDSGANVDGGMGVFLNESASNVYTAKTDNIIGIGNVAYIVVDPNVNDVTVLGSTTTPIMGAPFVWTLGNNSTGSGTLSGTNVEANLIDMSFTGTPASGNSNGAFTSCNTPLSAIGVVPDPGTADTTNVAGHTSSTIPDIPNPALSGDYLHFMAIPQDWSFDKFGNLWIANKSWVNTTTTLSSQILSSLTKLTPAYGSALNTSSTSNFTFSIIHNVAGLVDGSTITNYPQYLTTDGAGNVWFALSNSPYLNAVSNTGTALSPNGASTTTAGFAGSICTCTFNGSAQTYQRPTLTINRPAVDLSGNVWVPVSGVGSTYVDLLVGIAAPRVTPDSLGLKNSTFASQP